MIHGDVAIATHHGLTGSSKTLRVLVATTGFARNSRADIAHVINYDLPEVAENFIHALANRTQWRTRCSFHALREEQRSDCSNWSVRWASRWSACAWMIRLPFPKNRNGCR